MAAAEPVGDKTEAPGMEDAREARHRRRRRLADWGTGICCVAVLALMIFLIQWALRHWVLVQAHHGVITMLVGVGVAWLAVYCTARWVGRWLRDWAARD